MTRTILQLTLFACSISASPLFAQQYVDASGSCGGNTPCNLTIQAAVTAATPGSVINVYPGAYNEKVIINKALTLQSTGGSAATTIQYPLRGNYEAPIRIPSPTSNVTIGGQPGKGFTIIGMDNTNDATGAGMEAAAILIGAGTTPMSNISISDNILTANGEGAILTYSSATTYLNNLSIVRNTINGKTYEGVVPSPGGPFTNYNAAKPAVTVNPGAANTIFSYNIVSPQTGNAGLGNGLVLITSAGSTVTENNFNGIIAGFTASLLNLRGTSAAVQCNVFNFSNSPSALIVLNSSGTAPYVGSAAANANTFQPSSIYYSGSSFYNLPSGTPANYVYPAPGCTVPLPIEYIRLSAALDDNKLTSLWSINEDEAGSLYQIQTSCNGSDFKVIDELTAKGNGTLSYTRLSNIIDLCTPMQVRIKHTANNGKVLYSNVTSVQTSNGNSDVIVYPNPAKDYISIKMNQANAVVSLFDYTGRKVLEQQISREKNRINIQSLTQGIYLIRVSTLHDLVIYSGKIVK